MFRHSDSIYTGMPVHEIVSHSALDLRVEKLAVCNNPDLSLGPFFSRTEPNLYKEAGTHFLGTNCEELKLTSVDN